MSSASSALIVTQVLTAALVSYMIFADVRYTFRRRASKNWATTEASVEDGRVGFRGPFSWLPRVLYRVHFIYSYSVDGSKYNGTFFLLAGSEVSGEELRKGIVGRNILINFDNHKPGVAFVVEQELMGKRVMQGPSWIYR